jgi:hypothetical protein
MITTLEHASIGFPLVCRGITLFPLYVHQADVRVTAGGDNDLEISERPDAEVPSLHVRNRAVHPVLLVEGETVLGGRQNRVINTTIVVPAASEIDIPVTCVEQGRWHGQQGFDRHRRLAPRRVRRTKLTGVVEDVARSGGRRADQGAVWSAVHSEMASRMAHNDTGDMLAMEAEILRRDDRLRREIDELVAMGPLPGQKGVVVSRGSRVLSVEVFGSTDLLSANWEGLVRSAMLDADGRRHRPASASQALRFVRRLMRADGRTSPGLGIGDEHHIRTDRLVAQAVLLNDSLIHASAFALAA